MERQSYSSLEHRDRDRYDGQTILPHDFLPQTTLPFQPGPTYPPRHIFTIENNNAQSSPQTKTTTCINNDICVIICLILLCLLSSIVLLGLLGYAGYTGLEIYNLKTVSDVASVTDMWKYIDETTLCVSLSGKHLRHSGCARYLFHDVSDNKNYTCCVRDSSQFSFLYQMINEEQRRQTSYTKNTYCTHSNAISGVLSNGTIPWTATHTCQLNGKTGNFSRTSVIVVPKSQLYFIYLTLTVRFEETYKLLRYQKVTVTLIRRHYNGTNSIDNDLLHKVLDVRKEWQNFENIFLHGTFALNKGDTLFVKVWNKKFLYTFNKYISIGLFRI